MDINTNAKTKKNGHIYRCRNTDKYIYTKKNLDNTQIRMQKQKRTHIQKHTDT